jgi:hypothetical protein
MKFCFTCLPVCSLPAVSSAAGQIVSSAHPRLQAGMGGGLPDLPVSWLAVACCLLPPTSAPAPLSRHGCLRRQAVTAFCRCRLSIFLRAALLARYYPARIVNILRDDTPRRTSCHGGCPLSWLRHGPDWRLRRRTDSTNLSYAITASGGDVVAAAFAVLPGIRLCARLGFCDDAFLIPFHQGGRSWVECS